MYVCVCELDSRVGWCSHHTGALIDRRHRFVVENKKRRRERERKKNARERQKFCLCVLWLVGTFFIATSHSRWIFFYRQKSRVASQDFKRNFARFCVFFLLLAELRNYEASKMKLGFGGRIDILRMEWK